MDFEDIDRLVANFQRNIDAGPFPRTVSAIVPIKNPMVWGSSAEGSIGSGLGGSNESWRCQTNSDREQSSNLCSGPGKYTSIVWRFSSSVHGTCVQRTPNNSPNAGTVY